MCSRSGVCPTHPAVSRERQGHHAVTFQDHQSAVHTWELVLAKVTELKGWVTPGFPFMALDDNIYEADDGWTELMITQDQKYYKSASEKTQGAFIPLFLFLKKKTTTSDFNFTFGLTVT